MYLRKRNNFFLSFCVSFRPEYPLGFLCAFVVRSSFSIVCVTLSLLAFFWQQILGHFILTFWVILVLWCSYLCHLWAVHSEGQSVRQGGGNSPFLLELFLTILALAAFDNFCQNHGNEKKAIHEIENTIFASDSLLLSWIIRGEGKITVNRRSSFSLQSGYTFS